MVLGRSAISKGIAFVALACIAGSTLMALGISYRKLSGSFAGLVGVLGGQSLGIGALLMSRRP